MDPLEFEAQYMGTFAFERPEPLVTTVAHWLDREPGYVYIGRPSIYGNPFRLPYDGDRTTVIALYRAYFEKRVAEDDVFRLAVHGLRGRQLVCHCKPMDCHGDVIAAHLNSMENQ